MEYNECLEKLNKNQQIIQVFNSLPSQITADFVGLALQNANCPDVRWHFAAGNSNDKYKRITVRYGKGIAGKVISTGRPVTINNFPENISGKALEYPIMLAEKLVVAFAAPIFYNGIPKGVLLAGRRSHIPFTDAEQKALTKAAVSLEGILANLF